MPKFRDCCIQDMVSDDFRGENVKVEGDTTLEDDIDIDEELDLEDNLEV